MIDIEIGLLSDLSRALRNTGMGIIHVQKFFGLELDEAVRMAVWLNNIHHKHTLECVTVCFRLKDFVHI